MSLVFVTWRLFLQLSAPVTGDPFPYFKPDPPHWLATECTASDGDCLGRHDQRVQDLAIMTGDVGTCWKATRVAACADVVRMTLGQWAPRTASAQP
jgi:hypothetical protein